MTTEEMFTTAVAAIGAVAAIAAVVIPLLRASGRNHRYDRWLLIAASLGDTPRGLLAQRRARYYFVELAAADISRRRRGNLVLSGIGLLAFAAFYFYLYNTLAGSMEDAEWVVWGFLGFAFLCYLGGLACLAYAFILTSRTRRSVAAQLDLDNEYQGEVTGLRYPKPDPHVYDPTQKDAPPDSLNVPPPPRSWFSKIFRRPPPPVIVASLRSTVSADPVEDA